MGSGRIWEHLGYRLKKLEWGLWKAVDEPGRYFLCYRPRGYDGPFVRRWATTGPGLTLDDLRQHVRDVRAQIQSRKLGVPASVDCRLNAGEYVAELRRMNRTERHVQEIERTIERFAEHAQVRTLAQIGVRHVQEFLQQLDAEGASPRTQNKLRGHLAAWLSWAQGRGDIEDNPADHVPRAKETQKLKRFPMPHEMIRLVDESESRYDAALWTFLALTGLRRGSFLSLTLESFREDGILVPHTKRGTEWFLSYADGCPLWKPELSALGRRIWHEREPTPDYLRCHFRASCKAAGLDITLHSLRHGFCSWLVMMGEHMSDIAAWAHHASAATTEKWYAHLRPRGRDRLEQNRRDVFTFCSHGLKKAMGQES